MKGLLTICLLLFVGGAMADQRAHDAAAELFAAIDMPKVMDQAVEQTLVVQMKANPAMQPYEAVFRRFFAKYLSYEAIKEDLAQMYMQSFSADELAQLSAFYKTELGRKTLETMPELMRKGGELGMSRVQAHLPELRTMIEAEALRLKSLQTP